MSCIQNKNRRKRSFSQRFLGFGRFSIFSFSDQLQVRRWDARPIDFEIWQSSILRFSWANSNIQLLFRFVIWTIEFQTRRSSHSAVFAVFRRVRSPCQRALSSPLRRAPVQNLSPSQLFEVSSEGKLNTRKRHVEHTIKKLRFHGLSLSLTVLLNFGFDPLNLSAAAAVAEEAKVRRTIFVI